MTRGEFRTCVAKEANGLLGEQTEWFVEWGDEHSIHMPIHIDVMVKVKKSDVAGKSDDEFRRLLAETLITAYENIICFCSNKINKIEAQL